MSEGRQVAKHKKNNRKDRISARECVGTGLGGAALFGIGMLLATPSGAPAPTVAAPAVQLTSVDSLLAPAPLSPEQWWLRDGDNLIGAAAVNSAGGFNLFKPIGTGGWFYGNGVSAVAGCQGDACNGGNAGFWGCLLYTSDAADE